MLYTRLAYLTQNSSVSHEALDFGVQIGYSPIFEPFSVHFWGPRRPIELSPCILDAAEGTGAERFLSHFAKRWRDLMLTKFASLYCVVCVNETA